VEVQPVAAAASVVVNARNEPAGEPDVLAMYEAISGLKSGPVTIYVKRLTGTQVVDVIDSQPPLGSGLYRELKRIHGKHPEAEYEITFRSGREQRGIGHITMPSVAEDFHQPQQGQVMPTQWQPPPPQPYQQSVHQQQSPAPQQQSPASPMDLWAAFQAMQRQQLELLQEMQRTAAVQQPQQQQPVAQPPPPSPPLPPPPPAAPPPGASPLDQWAAFQAMQRQQLELLQEMQRTAAVQQPQQQQPVAQPPPQVQPQSSPPPAQQPPMQGPPGTAWVPNVGFVRLDLLYQAMTGERSTGYRTPPGPRSSYYAGEAPPPAPIDGQQPPPTYDPRYRPTYGQPQQPPPREKTPVELMREALGLAKTIVTMADEIRPPQQPVASEPEEPDDDSPVRVVDLGGAKGVFNTSDGSTRVMESLIANVPGIFKAAGDAWESVRKARAEEEARRQKPQLPPGYVEVGPGYVPPEGFVAVPVGQPPPAAHRPAPQYQPSPPQPVMPIEQPAQQTLPDPPSQMPMPIEELQYPRTWEPPPFTPGGGG